MAGIRTTRADRLLESYAVLSVPLTVPHGIRVLTTACHFPQSRSNIKTVFSGGGFQLWITFGRENYYDRNVILVGKWLYCERTGQKRIIAKVQINFDQFQGKVDFETTVTASAPCKIPIKFWIFVCVVVLTNVHHYGCSRWVNLLCLYLTH